MFPVNGTKQAFRQADLAAVDGIGGRGYRNLDAGEA